MAEVNKDKLKALQATLDRMDKSYGKGTIMRLGDQPIEEMDVISTGSIALDKAFNELIHYCYLLKIVCVEIS